jgi:alkylhydroperoxidase family enzyme
MTWIEEAPSNKGAIIKSMSINNAAMEAVANLNANTTFGSSALTRVQEEAIATTVAAANHCRY